MKKAKLALLVVLVTILIAPFSIAESKNGTKTYIGLWQGVDPLDGSEALRSITIDDDEKFQIIGYESYYNGCGNPRGIVTATGFIEDGVLVTDYFALECFGGNTYDGIDVEYIYDKKNNTIIETIGGGFPPVILHRIDRK